MSGRRSIVLADGDRPTRAELDRAWPGWSEGIDHVVAADGGARLATELGLSIDAWVGDGDSLGEAGVEALRRSGIPVDRSPADKDASDTELGLLAAITAGASEITILGALGGSRFDHALANVALLAHPLARSARVVLLDPRARVRLVQAPDPAGRAVHLDLAGRPGDLVSLLPIGDVAGVTTEGLRYGLDDEGLPAGPARGLSNVRDGTAAGLTLRQGRLLVVEVPATLPE